MDAKEEDWDTVVDVNLKSLWLCMKHDIPEMLKWDGGAFANNSAEIVLRGSLDFSFAASKHGVRLA